MSSKRKLESPLRIDIPRPPPLLELPIVISSKKSNILPVMKNMIKK